MNIDSIWNLLQGNSFIGAFIGAFTSGLLLALIGWIVSLTLRKYRAKRLYNLFKNELILRDKEYLSVHLLSSITGYTENEVEILCSSYPEKIKRNELEKPSWRLVKPCRLA